MTRILVHCIETGEIIGEVRPPATELTPIGEQYVMPGCERKETARGKRPAQATLWDVS
jgi:hypothetical protein